MKFNRFIAILACALLLVAVGAGFAKAAEQEAKPEKVLRHVALFKFKDNASAEDIKAVTTAFGTLQSQIKVIQDYEWGTDISPEHQPDGYTHCLIVTLKSEADRDAYIADPARKQFAALINKVIVRSMVFDYWVQR